MTQRITIDAPEKGALPGYYKFWLEVDGPIEATILREGGMSGKTALRAANAYSVARTFGGDAPERWDWIAERILQLAGQWKHDLLTNAELCVDAALNVREKLGGKAPYSGVSKLVWFLRPEGWTIYDSFAAKALIGSSPGDRFKRFYRTLDGPFQEGCGQIAEFALEVEPRLRAERIIDQLLVLRGMPPPQQASRLQEIEDWLSCLPEHTRETILAANDEIAPRLSALPHKTPRRHLRRKDPA